MSLEVLISLFLFAILAGFSGALVGIGGGLIIVPALTLLYGVPVHVAIAVSIVCVIATGTAGALSYVKQEITNLHVVMFLEMATTAGAIIGALVSVLMHGWVLSLIFGALILYMAAVSLRAKEPHHEADIQDGLQKTREDRISKAMNLSGTYHDRATGEDVHYSATKTIKGSLVASVAGLGSGMLGIGGGVIKVAAMNSVMRLPMKVSVATSAFMITITAATAAIVYFMAGVVNLYIVAPTALGTILGATLGSKLMNRLHARVIKIIFFAIMLYFGYGMVANGLSLGFGIKLPGLL